MVIAGSPVLLYQTVSDGRSALLCFYFAFAVLRHIWNIRLLVITLGIVHMSEKALVVLREI